MGNNYIFSLQPTFTQGLILGQLSILILLGLILKFLFLDSSEYPSESLPYQPQGKTDSSPWTDPREDFHSAREEAQEKHAESADWFNLLARQIAGVYRSKLRDDLPGAEGDEIARKRIEDYANKMRPASFLDHITIHSVNLGSSAPRLANARLTTDSNAPLQQQIEFDLTYTDSFSVSLSTAYLFNYPMSSFARLPVSLTVSLSLFKSMITLTPPSPLSAAPVLTVSLPADFTLDLKTSSLMGSRAKLADVPKLHELIQNQVHRILASRSTWKVVLPGLGSVSEAKHEIEKEEAVNS